jgi:hypothetical protein
MPAHPPEEITELAAGYVRYAEGLARDESADTPELTAAEQAYGLVEKAVRTGPAGRACELVVEILRRAPDERLDVYAAGILEDLVKFRGAEVIEAVEREAAADERFRWALGCIWLLVGEVPLEVQDRIVRASGGQVRPLDAGPLAAALIRLPPNDR